MLKWDEDVMNDQATAVSDVSGRLKRFSPHGQTLHDFEHRFQAEDADLISEKHPGFKWEMLDGNLNYRIPGFFGGDTDEDQSETYPAHTG